MQLQLYARTENPLVMVCRKHLGRRNWRVAERK